jgi:hypothetical protein
MWIQPGRSPRIWTLSPSCTVKSTVPSVEGELRPSALGARTMACSVRGRGSPAVVRGQGFRLPGR